MKKTTYILALLFLSILFSCNENKKTDYKENFTNKEGFKVIEIKENNRVECLKESEFIEKTEFIRLETNPSCIIGRIDKISIDSTYIYIFDRNISKSLFVFKRNGQFVKKMGAFGKGPNEYIGIMDFKVLKNNKLMLFDFSGRKMLYFDNLKYTHSKKIEGTINSISENDSYYYINTIKEGQGDFNLLIANKNFKVLKKEFPYPPGSQNFFSLMYDFRDYKDSITYVKSFENKIYRIKGTTIIPKYYFDFGDKQLTYEQVNFSKDYHKVFEKFSFFDGVFYESELFLVFNAVINGNVNVVLYNKKTGVLKYSRMIDTVALYLNSNDKYIIGNVDAKSAHDMKQDKKEKYGLTNVDEMDNPIISISYFK